MPVLSQGTVVTRKRPTTRWGIAGTYRAAADHIADFYGPNDLRNLALACRSCNSGKGRDHDTNGPLDPRAREIVVALLEKRAKRFVPLDDQL